MGSTSLAEELEGLTVDQQLALLEKKRKVAERLMELSLAESVASLASNAGDLNQESPYGYEGGTNWLPFSSGIGGPSRATAAKAPIQTWQDLDRWRQTGRKLWAYNEFAKSGHENRVNYVVGTGWHYTVAAEKGEEVPEQILEELNRLVRVVSKKNKLGLLEQELVNRADRDGEWFLEITPADHGANVRAVDPEDVVPGATADSEWGVIYAPGDTQTVIGYMVTRDGDAASASLVPAERIVHYKQNVDANVLRGVPTFVPVADNLRRSERLLRNMSTIAEIHAAIALVKKYERASVSAARSVTVGGRDTTVKAGSGREMSLTGITRGSVLSLPRGVDIVDPFTNRDPAKGVPVLQAELRAVAAMLVMPEFMFSADSSNSNYSAVLVSEAPSTRMFERLQSRHAYSMDEFWEKVFTVAGYGQWVDLIRIDKTPPTLTVRDSLRDAQSNQILNDKGVKSLQTWREEEGLDNEKERERIEGESKEKLARAKAMQAEMGMRPIAPGEDAPPSDDPEDQGEDDAEEDDQGGKGPPQPRAANGTNTTRQGATLGE